MPELTLNGNTFSVPSPAIMGVLNVTPDSFSDGGRHFSVAAAVERAGQMREEGALFIDVGGESTRPGSDPVSVEEEMRRVLPVIEALPKDDFILSADTTKPEVAEAALAAGAHVLNDVSGVLSPERIALAEKYGAGYVFMHAQGTPKTMQDAPSYADELSEVRAFFEEAAAEVSERALPAVWMDPGIGFGKTLSHNLTLMRRLDALRDERWELLVGVSRKSWVHHLCGNAPEPEDRLGASLAAALRLAEKGAAVLRVHDVAETAQALKVFEALRNG